MLSASGTAAATGGAAGATPFGTEGLVCPMGVAEVVGWFGCWLVLELEIQIAIPIATAAQTVTILIGVKNPELGVFDSGAISTDLRLRHRLCGNAKSRNTCQVIANNR